MIHVYKEERPWGSFERFTKEVPSTVKIITVIHGQSTSLQYHYRRQEYWRVLQGNPIITIGDKEISAQPGNEFFIDKRVTHRIAASNNNSVVLEISLGRFDEDDIVRLQDRYGRTSKQS
jgi:mannose-6-phosphate isomerase-like protein (cupin superfamily)